MKDNLETYKIREEIHPWFDYLFDKITGLFVKSKYHKIKNPKKILFTRNDHIGDMVYSTQIFREIKKRFPKVKITVIATPSNRQIIDKDPYVDNIIEIDLSHLAKGIYFVKIRNKDKTNLYKIMKE